MIKIKDIFNEYKSQLKLKMEDKIEYKEYSEIFDMENVNFFTIHDLYEFLQIYLKDNKYSITKRDITNYNLFIEILNQFNELYYMYEENVDVKFTWI